MEKMRKALRSRTVWTIVFGIIISSFNMMSPVLSPETLTLVNTVLGAFAVYFKLNPSQKY